MQRCDTCAREFVLPIVGHFQQTIEGEVCDLRECVQCSTERLVRHRLGHNLRRVTALGWMAAWRRIALVPCVFARWKEPEADYGAQGATLDMLADLGLYEELFDEANNGPGAADLEALIEAAAVAADLEEIEHEDAELQAVDGL